MNSDKRKEISKIKSEKDDEKQKAIDLHDVKTTAQCKSEKDATRAEMLATCAEQQENLTMNIEKQCLRGKKAMEDDLNNVCEEKLNRIKNELDTEHDETV